MKPGDRKPIPTVAEVVQRAVALCDPSGRETGMRAFLEAFEDDDRPVTAVEDLAGELLGVARNIDPDRESPAVEMSAASAVWLATNMDQAEDRERVLREAARLVYGDRMPENLRTWVEREVATA